METPLVIERIWLTQESICIQTEDGRVAEERFADYPRLRHATPEQLADFTHDEFGIHWNQLDEDLSFEGFFAEHPHNTLYDLFMAHPELNAAAVARRLGIPQTLFSQYVSGSAQPSAERSRTIASVVQRIGHELVEASSGVCQPT